MTDQKILESFLRFIENNYYKNIRTPDMAEAAGCSSKVLNRILEVNFGLSAATFLKKYRLRRAAREVHMKYKSLDAIGMRNGFKTKTFYGEFKKEFGMSPGEYHCSPVIADMPVKKYIHGYPLHLEYKIVPDVDVEGIPIEVPMTDDFNLLDNASYVFYHSFPHVDLTGREKTWGIWWYDFQKRNRLYYLVAHEAGHRGEQTDERKKNSGELNVIDPDKGKGFIHITGGKYAVFAVSRGNNNFDTADHARELAWYAFKFWAPLNFKEADKWGFTYEIFDEENVYLYVPLNKGFGGIEIERDSNNHMIERIIRYIDAHILEIMDVNDLVAHFGNHDIYYRSQFKSCYKVSLPDYIRNKRLYVLAQKLQNKEIARTDLVDRYHYESYRQFEKEFMKIYGVLPEQYQKVTAGLPDLQDYYSENFSKIRITKKKIDDRTFAGRIVRTSADKTEIDMDIPQMTAFWMEKMTGQNEGCSHAVIAMYESDTSVNPLTYNYVVGPVCGKEEKLPEETHAVTVWGGTYLSFSVSEKAYTIPDAIRMLVRCVDHVWMYDNWLRTDFRKRACFYYYDGNMIHYCVPVYS